MKREQIKQLIQFILARILVILFVAFVVQQPLVDVILSYRWLFLILSVSYFYYYSIEYEIEKKYESIRKMVIYGNVYLLAFVFFRPLLNISGVLFIVLGLVILGLRGTTKMESKWKKVLRVLGGLISFLILISGMFYLYPESPDIQGFLKGRNVEILVKGVQNSVDKSEAYLQIVTSKKNEDFMITENLQKKIVESCSIMYRSLKYDRNERILILSKNGDVVQIFPQTEIELEFSGENLSLVNVNNGKVGFLSGVLDSNFGIEGNVISIDEKSLNALQQIQSVYKSDLILYLKNQISGGGVSIVTNGIVRKIDGKLLLVLSKIFPISYGDNLENYREFQKYFSLEDELIEVGNVAINTDYYINNSIWGDLVDNMGIGKSNVYTGKAKDLKKFITEGK